MVSQLRIRAIGYDASEFLLRWDYLLSLAESAQKNPARKDGGLGAGDKVGTFPSGGTFLGTFRIFAFGFV